MTVVGAILDPNPLTRGKFLQALEERVKEPGASPLKQTTVGDCTCCWRTCQSAPVSTARHGRTTAWILGHRDGVEETGQSCAEAIASRLDEKGVDGIVCHSGYFLAVVCREDDYYVFTDRLGLFPCYYRTTDSVLVAGTSSDIPTLHASASRKANWKGILGHLLCMHEVLGESVWEGSARLGMGEVLHFTNKGLRILRQQAIPVSDESFGLPYEAQLDKAHAAMMETFSSYRGKSVSVLLSGGLDSRLIAAYLSKSGVVPEAVYTLGDPRDIEFRCARGVCRSLRWPQSRIGVAFSQFPHHADRQFMSEQLANGLNNLSWWSLVDAVEGSRLPILSGLLGDAVLGGSHISTAYDPTSRRYSFDQLFKYVNGWGVSAELLCRLFPNVDARACVAEIVERLRGLYESLPGYDFQKPWQFDLMHRQRFHIGATLRRLSHGFWPFAPLASNAVLATAGGMPACTISGRRLQRDLLITRFLELARLPLDRNSQDPAPLAPSVWRRLRGKIARKTGIEKLRFRSAENRYYYRIYDINSEGWRAIRCRCDECLPGLSGVVDLDEWRRILPGPDTEIRPSGDAISSVSGLRCLIAFALWHDRYLAAHPPSGKGVQ